MPAIKRKLDGKSLAPIIKSPKAPSAHETLHWESCGMWAVRQGKWKLVGGKSAGLFLSDMNADVTETKNLAKKHPEVVTKLNQLHRKWRKESVKQ